MPRAWRRFGHGARWLLRQGMLEIILLAVCVGLALREPRFLSVENFQTVLRSVAAPGMIALGMTMVIVAGEIDLSVGSMVALSGCLVGWLIEAGMPAQAAIAATLAVAAGAGTGVSLMRSWFEVPSFITTLALMAALRGAALLLAGGQPPQQFPPWYVALGSGYLPPVALLVCFLAAHFLVNYTVLGRAVYAVGGNVEAARLSGIRVTLVRSTVLAMTAVLAAVAGILESARLKAADPNTLGLGWELDVIAAVIIGGTSLAGGVGTVWGTLVGVVFIGVILNGMTMLDVPTDWQYVVRGAIILAAVLVNQLQRRPGD